MSYCKMKTVHNRTSKCDLAFLFSPGPFHASLAGKKEVFSIGGNLRRHDTLRNALGNWIRNTARNYGVCVQLEKRFAEPHIPTEMRSSLSSSETRRLERASAREAEGSLPSPTEQLRIDVFADNAEFAAQPQGFDVSVVSPHSKGGQ